MGSCRQLHRSPLGRVGIARLLHDVCTVRLLHQMVTIVMEDDDGHGKLPCRPLYLQRCRL